jgi:hypothetical protein
MQTEQDLGLALAASVATLLVVLGGFMLMAGARRIAGRMIVIGVLVAAIAPLVSRVLGELPALPAWALAVVAFLGGLMAMQGLLALCFGRDVAARVTAQVILTLFVGPIRLAAAIARRYFGAG